MSKSMEAAVAKLSAVGLDDLRHAAELQIRKDRKYIVPLNDLTDILIDNGLSVLEIDGRRSFHYESVYFDTSDLLTYKAAAHKRRRRFKVRTRSYMDSGLCWIEVKVRSGRGMNEKHRLPYDITKRDRLTEEGLDFINGFGSVAAANTHLRPVLTTRYDRITLLEEETSSRVTVDIGFEAEDRRGDKTGLADVAIVETKTDGNPCSIDHALWAAHHRPTKISKFAAGLAVLTPGLPANKWNRALREYFGWVPAQRQSLPLPYRLLDRQHVGTARLPTGRSRSTIPSHRRQRRPSQT